MTEPDDGARRHRTRSPSYPAIGLEEAITRTGAIYRNYITHAVRVPTVITMFGLSPRSGTGSGIVAALIKFGLLNDEGTGDARAVNVTDIGRRIVLRPMDSAERIQLVRDAALRPTIHRELWERFGATLPDDTLLKDFLIVDRAFNPAVVDDFIQEYRDTLAYAGLLGGDNIVPQAQDEGLPEDDVVSATVLGATARATAEALPGAVRATAVAPTEKLRLPMFDKAVISMSWDTPMTEDEWEAMVTMLTALKPAMAVRTDAPQPEASSHE